MPCLFVVLIALFPRLALALLFFFTNYITQAYHGILIPLLGFIFLPLTTIVYAYLVHISSHPTEGINLVFLILAVVVDVGGLGGGYSHRRRDW
jgi:hypothetical protein